MLSISRSAAKGVTSQFLAISALILVLFVAGCTTAKTETAVGPAAKLAFTVQPGNAAAGSAIAPAVAVSIEDASGNLVTTATTMVSIAIGTNPSAGTLAGTTSVAAVGGVATFSGLSINNAGAGYTLTASGTGLTGAMSSAFTVTGVPAKLAFTVQPSAVVNGSAITPAVTVSVEDAQGNVVPNATNQVTLALGANPSAGTLGGTLQANAVAGVATFANLTVNKVGAGYTLTAAATNLTGATSNAFNVTAGAPAKLAFTVQPTNTTAGAAINPAVQVSIEDAQGNVVTTATNSIMIGSNATLNGTTSSAAVAGVATFASLSINAAGTGDTLTASAAGLTGATSNPFNILVGAAANLKFTVEPSNVLAGASITPAVVVSITDAVGNVVPTATNQVSLAFGTNPSAGTLGGTTSVTAVTGVATFSNLSVNNVGTGYTLAASAAGLTGSTSTTFNVTIGTASKLVFTAQPTSTTAGSSITPAVTVSVEDAAGNVVTSATNSITIANNASGIPLGGTLVVAAVNGVATFPNLSINTSGTYQLTAAATGLTGAISTAFNITAGTASKLVFTGQPSNVIPGNPISPAVTVSIEDSLGNVVLTATNSITVAIGTNPSAGTLSGTLVVAATSGVATFPNLSINNAGVGYTLTAAATGFTTITSNAFSNVAAGVPSKLVFSAQPTNVLAGSSITPAVTVSIEDGLGNLVASATNTVTIAIANNPSSGTLGGTVSAAAVAGVATFSNLSVNNTGNGYTLSAASAGLTGATSSAFNVTAGTASKLAFTVQPTNVVAGSAIAPAITVSVEDAAGNVVTTANNSITMTIANNPSSGTLAGTTSVAAVNGVATFNNLNINNAGFGYTLSAGATGLTSATSSSFNVSVGTASKLAFTAQPTSVISGSSIAPSIVVSVEDSQGNVVTTANNQITMAIGNNPASGTLSGTVSVTAVNGLATFSNLSINNAGTGYTLMATSTGLTAATSSAFNVTFGTASKLAFTVQPTNVAGGSVITPAVKVSVEDAAGNVVTSDNTDSITLAIGTNPAAGTLGGTVTITAVSGVASFSTLTINNSGAGYTLTAAATGFTTVTSSAFNVTGSCTSNCTISGNVSGPTIAGVAMALTGPSSANTTTDASGNYTFSGLAAGTYTVTPTLAGFTFTPAAPQVTITAATMTQNFVETAVVSTFSISGTLTYGGAHTGITFIRVLNTNNCNNNGCEVAGTSLPTAPTSGGVAYTVRGLQPGTYTVTAEVDTLNNGEPNSSNPWGNSTAVVVSNANITGANVTLSDPTPPAPVAPSGLTIDPGSSFVLVMYNNNNSNPLRDSNGREIATSYKVYYDTNSGFTHGTFATISAHGLDNKAFIIPSLISGTYYFKMTALVGTTESAPSSTVSATLAAGTGPYTVSGTVTFPGTATGPLYVGLLDQTAGKIYGKRIASPTSGVAFSITGVPAGNYQEFAIIDQNSTIVGEAGVILPNDISNVNNSQGGPPPLTVSGNISGNAIALTSAFSTITPTTNHNQTNGAGDSYGLNFNVNWGSKRPVAITLSSGPNVAVPWDMPVDMNNGYQPVFQNGAIPMVGDTYQFQVTFSDGTTSTMPASITAVLNSFATGLSMNSPVVGTTTVPVLNWVTPASPPSPYTYQVGLYSTSGTTNVQWNDYGSHGNGIPSGTTNVTFNADGSASANGSSISSLPTGTNYNWYVQVQDSNGNTAQETANYNIP